MAPITKSIAEGSEPLRPEEDLGARRFVVVITEIGDRIVHKQEWVTFVDPDTKAERGGRHTSAHREEVKREIFRGEFGERPVVSELAKLLEGQP